MLCKNCGQQIDPHAAVCIHCGVAKNVGNKFCANCGEPANPGAAVCVKCGAPLGSAMGGGYAGAGTPKSKMVAGLLGIFLGSIGIHNFYLGFTKKAIIQIVVTFVTCGIGGIWGFVEGILILCGNISADANGVPLTQ